MKKLNTKGFSIVELAIVVVVVGVLVGLGLYTKNRMDNKSSKAESRNSLAEPTQVDNDTRTMKVLTTQQKTATDRSYSKVIDNASYGQVFACRISGSAYDGVKYYFSGANASFMWVDFNASNPNGPSGGGSRSPRLERKNTVQQYRPTGRAPANFITSWRFSLKNTANSRTDSPWIVHSNLNRCP